MSTPAARPELEVPVTTLQRHYADLVDAAIDGHTVVLTRRGVRVAMLVPYGLPVDDLATFEALMDDALQRVAAARDFGRRRHAEEPK